MPRKKIIEAEAQELSSRCAELEKQNADLLTERGELIADIRAQSAVIAELEARDPHASPYAALEARIDADVAAASSTPGRQWSLQIIRKGLKGLTSKE